MRRVSSTPVPSSSDTSENRTLPRHAVGWARGGFQQVSLVPLTAFVAYDVKLNAAAST